MRVVTFNIRYGNAADGPNEWKHRRDGLHHLLLALDPDVLCLQEALQFQVKELATWLPNYSWVGAGRDDGLHAGEHAPIFVKDRSPRRSDTFWLSPTPDIPGSMGWGAKHPRICTWAEVDGILIANIHMDHESALARSEGMAVVLDRIQGPAIICGDFNAEPDEPFFEGLAQSDFHDLAAGTGDTFNGFGGGPFARIDYVFGRGFQSASARVIRAPMVSDHWPVVVEIETPG